MLSLFVFVLVFLISFAIYRFEQSKIDKIVRSNLKEKEADSNFIFNKNAKFKITGSEKNPNKFDLSKTTQNIFVGIKDGIQGINSTEKSIIVIDSENKSNLKNPSQKIVNAISTNIFLLLRKFGSFIFKLRIEVDNFVKQRHNEDDNQNQIILADNLKIKEQTIKIKEIGKTLEDTSLDKVSLISEDLINKNRILPPIHKNISKKNSSATIDITSNAGEKEEIFNKIENSILERLKKTSLTDYGIWLELGMHYEKFHEFDKSKEVYALVMKHAKDQEKDFAKNKLIALS